MAINVVLTQVGGRYMFIDSVPQSLRNGCLTGVHQPISVFRGVNLTAFHMPTRPRIILGPYLFEG
jgi:hypothetical protein